ncbi:GRF-type domain-containing protein [Heracleum sosnowskyi]|uniref:GRF-type domain-containing protein n=1 Tax=Heracleum sosnowskyi TaxID=360622 RepID=A0AAD8GUY4_9APIA|nr:GRF-type domain-containing protein [Heracleum sosnowskyi]
MSAMSNSSSKNWDHTWVVCNCGMNARLRTSWTSKNPGKRFWSCCKPKEVRQCNFFMWMDDELGGRAKEIISELKQRNSFLEDQVMKLEDKLIKKKKKTEMVKKKKEAQFNMFCIIMMCFIAFILIFCIKKEFTNESKYLL